MDYKEGLGSIEFRETERYNFLKHYFCNTTKFYEAPDYDLLKHLTTGEESKSGEVMAEYYSYANHPDKKRRATIISSNNDEPAKTPSQYRDELSDDVSPYTKCPRRNLDCTNTTTGSI